MNTVGEDLKKRKENVVNFLLENKLDGYLVTDPFNIFYMCDFYHVPTERPVMYFISSSGESTLYVPQLEKNSADEHSGIPVEDIIPYPYTDIPSWVTEKMSEEYPQVKKIAFDQADYKLYQRLNEKFEADGSDLVYQLRIIKSPLEIEYLKKAASYSDYIVEQGFKIVKPGMSEIELLGRMETATVTKMADELPEVIYVPGGPAGGLIPSGPRTAFPHALPSGRKIKEGDSMILSCGANVMGYRIECERTIFIGSPDRKKVEAFEIMRNAQELGVSLMRPGARCSDIDKEVTKYIEDAGYGQYIKHTTGHGKGLTEHEPPSVSYSDDTVLEPGMILSCEPGIYIEGLAGFRHSDTVLVTESDPLILTKYPKDLVSVTKKL